MTDFDLSEITKAQIDVNFERYSLISNPFPMTGVSKENPEFYAGRDKTLDALRRYIIGSYSAIGWSGIVIVGDNGMGKTHTLKFIRDQINQQLSTRPKNEKCRAIYIAMPTSFEEIYIRIIKNINQSDFISLLWDAVSEDFKSKFNTQESLNSLIGSMDLSFFEDKIEIEEFNKYLTDWGLFHEFLNKKFISRQNILKNCEDFLKEIIHDKNMRLVCSKLLIEKGVQEECWRWLTGGKLYKEERSMVGVSSDFNSKNTTEALKSVVNLYRKAGYRRIFIMIDQFEDMIKQGDRSRLNFLVEFRDLIDSIQLSFSIVSASTPMEWETAKQTHPAFSDRFSGPVNLYPLDQNQMKALIEMYLLSMRPKNYNGEKIYPFTVEGIEKIREKSKGNPRHALETCHILIEKGKNAGYRPIDTNFVIDNVEDED
ncbi:MAG: BREX system ATP-binding domain-containing protein [Candidatus Methanoperedens sp.]